MKINSINNLNASYQAFKTPAFKHTAVPYPEYKDAYVIYSNKNRSVIDILSDKISDLFHPEISKEAKNIKSQINLVFDDRNTQKPVLNTVA